MGAGDDFALKHSTQSEEKIYDPLIKYPTYDEGIHKLITSSDDPIRYGTLALAINRVRKSNIEGSFAEVGVWRGDTSRFIHFLAPDRVMYLFDTFEGFPHQDLDREDDRFKDTSVEIVKATMGDLNNIVIRKGYFPETAKGLENEAFAFVLIDLDLYRPTLIALQFFYPRMKTGGYLFLHDYNSPESDYAVSRATDEFMRDTPEKLIEIPDQWGTVIIRKI